MIYCTNCDTVYLDYRLGLLFPIPTRTSTLWHGAESFHGFQCGAVVLALYSGFSVFFSLMLVKLMLLTNILVNLDIHFAAGCGLGCSNCYSATF